MTAMGTDSTTSPHRRPTHEISSGITSDPRAIVEISALSSAPKTRPRTSSGTSRCRIVLALTSTTGLAAPMTAMAMNAAAATGQTAISSSGTAQKMTPHPKSEASRCRVARATVSRPPNSAPMPRTESR